MICENTSKDASRVQSVAQKYQKCLGVAKNSYILFKRGSEMDDTEYLQGLGFVGCRRGDSTDH